MNLNELQKRLMQTARKNAPSDAVPYAFEKRITARLFSLNRADPLAFWSRMMWRAALSTVAATVLVGAWLAASPVQDSSLDDDFATTVLAGLNDIENNW